MAAISMTDAQPQHRLFRRWWLAGAAVVVVPASLALASWWFTEPLDESAIEASDRVVTIAPLVPREELTPCSKPTGPQWPDAKLEGIAAQALLVEILQDTSRRIDRMHGYTATFKKQERIDGKLLPEQTLTMKVRQHPFAIYFKFVAPHPGKEVVYAEGHHGNKLIAHNGDWTRRLVPRLAVEPTSPIALADSRHPITEAGLSNLAHKLLDFRKLDLEDSDAVTILDRVTNPDGRVWLRSVHLHSEPNPTRPFTKIEVLYDPATLFPLQIRSFDWPKPGETGEPLLAELYIYDNLEIDAPLTALDFDPANPKYEFQRF